MVPDQSVETCVRTLAAHHAAMGGVPLMAAFDRARPIGLRADGEGQVTEWDPAFAYATLELGLGVEVRARRGADRGPGTNLGNWLKLAFFKSATFTDEADVAAQLADWLRDYNAEPQNEVFGKAPTILLAEERQRLRPLKIALRDLALRFPVLVGPRASVVYEGQSYAMPPEAVGLIGVLQLYPDRVHIVAGRYEATHPRRVPSPYTRARAGVLRRRRHAAGDDSSASTTARASAAAPPGVAAAVRPRPLGLAKGPPAQASRGPGPEVRLALRGGLLAAADAVVREAGRAQLRRAPDVAAVEQHRLLQQRLQAVERRGGGTRATR